VENTEKIYRQITLTVNGFAQTFLVTTDEILTDTLRDKGGYTSVKRGCDGGECGCCTVIMNKKAVSSCMVLSVQADGANITTLEGLEKDNQLDPVQQAFLDHAAVQCGFCTPGMIMTAKALLDENPNPTEEEIVEAMENNYCRCTGFISVKEAIKSLAGNYEPRA